MYVCRQKVESLIFSSRISTDPQKRVFHDGDTVQLTFNIGMVWIDLHTMYICTDI